ncbi:hypothetical protein DL93DRAFT_2092036 [Clavulina sp. PMI_390]|nr:hypothetical protein DL93DRAFT_2092036 [Clavulina sp. PMI_390]
MSAGKGYRRIKETNGPSIFVPGVFGIVIDIFIIFITFITTIVFFIVPIASELFGAGKENRERNLQRLKRNHARERSNKWFIIIPFMIVRFQRNLELSQG